MSAACVPVVVNIFLMVFLLLLLALYVYSREGRSFFSASFIFLFVRSGGRIFFSQGGGGGDLILSF